MLVNKKIWLAFTSQANHTIVEVLNPSIQRLAIPQLHNDRGLPVAQGTQVNGFLPSFCLRMMRFLFASTAARSAHNRSIARSARGFSVITRVVLETVRAMQSRARHPQLNLSETAGL